MQNKNMTWQGLNMSGLSRFETSWEYLGMSTVSYLSLPDLEEQGYTHFHG